MSDQKYRKLSLQYSQSYMSNAKWRKFFSVIDKNDFFYHAQMKVIDDEEAFDYPLEKGLGLDETHLPDSKTTPFEYKWIQWIKVPKVHKYYLGNGVPFTKEQDLSLLNEALAKVGQFMTDLTDNSLTIYGYKK